MPWQDWVFFLGGLIVLVSLLPTIRGTQKPALATSLTTFVLVAIFAVTMASMNMWLSALINAAISLAWGVLALQRYRNDAVRRRKVQSRAQSRIVDVPAGSEAGGGS